LPGPVQQLRRIRAGAKPGNEKKDVVWFALNDDRPLFAFGGLWTEFKGDRGTKSKPIPGSHLVYGFLTTTPNAIVDPIHPKAMPVSHRLSGDSSDKEKPVPLAGWTPSATRPTRA
jgi:hypothetical protein